MNRPHRRLGALAFVAAAAAGVLVTSMVSLWSPSASANHAAAPNEITIASAAANTIVPVGGTFAVTLAVTTATTPYYGIQWELAIGSNLSFVSAVYNCGQFPSEIEVAPTEAGAGPDLKFLGQGSLCASLSGAFTGSTSTGVFVTVTLRCNANNTAPMFGVDLALDPNFGMMLLDSSANTIPTTLEEQYTTQSFGLRSGFDVICGVPSVVTATNTPSPTETPTETNTPTITPTPTITSTPTVTSTPCVSAGCPPGPTNALVINQETCFLAGPAFGGGPAIECASSDAGSFSLNLRYLGNRLAGRPVSDPTNPSYGDFATLDVDDNQLHETDGVLFVAVFLSEQGPLDITATNASLWPTGATVSPGRQFRCDFAFFPPNGDPDCVFGAPGADGAYVFAIRPDADTARGPGIITVSQGGHPKDFPFTVVGEAASIAITTLDAGVQAGAFDTTHLTATTADDCSLGSSAAADQTLSNTPERTFARAVVKDSDGTIITGAGVAWETDDATIASPATGFSPTIDFGALGVGAPQILCGTDLPGTTTIRARTMAKGPVPGFVPSGLPIDLAAPDLRTSIQLSVTANPLSSCATWRADVDGDGVVTLLDLMIVAGHFLEQAPPGPLRLDQDGDGAISMLDLTDMAQLFTRSALACGLRPYPFP